MAITLDKFKTAKANEYGEVFGLICCVPGSTAYEYVNDEHVFAICQSEEDGRWVCQIDDLEGGCEACRQGDTPEDALERAAADACQSVALRENDNCEDAVNEIAYEAFYILNGKYLIDTTDEMNQLNRLMEHATSFVKKNGEYYGIKWIPYQVSES